MDELKEKIAQLLNDCTDERLLDLIMQLLLRW